MASTVGSRLAFILGVVMILLGIFVALRPLLVPGRPLTGRVWLDVAFAALFLIRGVMNVRAAQAAARRARAAEVPRAD